MRFFTPLVAVLAAAVSAQTSSSGNPNYILIPQGGLQIAAGQNTIKWTNPTSGTVTIKLQQVGSQITSQSGLTVASGVPSSALTATFNIAAGQVSMQQYVLEIIDDTNTNTINFSSPFVIQGATGTVIGNPTSTGASSSAASTGSTTMMTTTMSTGTSTGTTSRGSTTSAPTSSRASTTTAAPTSSGAAIVKGVNGGLAVLIAGVVMAL